MSLRAVAAVLIAAAIASCASEPPYERGMTRATRAALPPIKVVTIVVQEELGAQYSTRSKTAKVLNTARISGSAELVRASALQAADLARDLEGVARATPSAGTP